MLTTSGAVDTGGNGCDVTAARCTETVDSIVGDGVATAANDWVLSRCNGVSVTCNASTWLVRLVLLVMARLVGFGSADAVLESDPLGWVNVGVVVLGRAVAVDEPKDGVVVRDSDDAGVFCAPPVLTVTPGGADAVVAPVETDTVLDVVVDPVAVCATASDGADVPDGGVASVDGLVDVPAGLVVDDPCVSADATPYPVITAAPTPKATAKPPTRPIYAAALTSRDSTRRVL